MHVPETTEWIFHICSFLVFFRLDLLLRNAMLIWPFAPYGFAHWPNSGKIWLFYSIFCEAHTAETNWPFFIRSSLQSSRNIALQGYGHLPIPCIWACPWTKYLAQIIDRCRIHISNTTAPVSSKSCQSYSTFCRMRQWASYQLRKIAHAPVIPGTFSPPPTSKEIAS